MLEMERKFAKSFQDTYNSSKHVLLTLQLHPAFKIAFKWLATAFLYEAK